MCNLLLVEQELKTYNRTSQQILKDSLQTRLDRNLNSYVIDLSRSTKYIFSSSRSFELAKELNR